MALCEHARDCGFFNKSLPVMPADSEQTIESYCRGNSLHCARSMIYDAQGGQAVPDDLMPQDKSAAYILLAEN